MAQGAAKGAGGLAQGAARYRTAARGTSVEILAYTVVAIALYLVSDWILRTIEARLGKTVPQRQVVFFVILLVLALGSFAILRSYLGQ